LWSVCVSQGTHAGQSRGFINYLPAMSKLRLSNKYGVAPHSVLYSRDISLKAKGLYTYMQSKPDGWQFSASRIALECKEERGSIEGGLKELDDAGYLKRSKHQNQQGHWEWVHTLSENPMQAFPASDNPAQENPAQENPAIKQEGYSKKDIVRSNQQTSEHSSQDVATVIDAFKDVNKANVQWYKNTTQRAAVHRLIETYSLELTLKVVAMLRASNTRAYFPTITTPVQLEQKWSQLEAAFHRYKLETNKIVML
jgi:hypothetical protein